MKNFICFTDGSFLKASGETHGGIVFTDNEANPLNRMHLYTTLPALVSMNNVGGEVMAAAAAIQSVVNTIKKEQEDGGLETYELYIIYDYEGVGKWATNQWAAKKTGTAWYKKLVQDLIASVPNFKVHWIWTKGHQSYTGNVSQDMITKGNHLADWTAAYDMSYTKSNNIPCINMDSVIKI